MEKKILIGTRSKGKFPEIVALLAELPFEFLNLNDVPTIPRDFEVDETADTFEGNAILKATTLGTLSGLLTVAEDSGLEVDALGGRPGVYSARYAPGSDEDRYRKLLSELSGVPEEKRIARFRAVVAIYDPSSDKVRTCEGTFEGRILTEPKGTNGFGYDPIFFVPQFNKTSAELSLKEKNLVSHRGTAFRKAKEILQKEFI